MSDKNDFGRNMGEMIDFIIRHEDLDQEGYEKAIIEVGLMTRQELDETPDITGIEGCA